MSRILVAVGRLFFFLVADDTRTSFSLILGGKRTILKTQGSKKKEEEGEGKETRFNLNKPGRMAKVLALIVYESAVFYKMRRLKMDEM